MYEPTRPTQPALRHPSRYMYGPTQPALRHPSRYKYGPTQPALRHPSRYTYGPTQPALRHPSRYTYRPTQPSRHSGTSGLIIQQNRIQSQTEGETSNYPPTSDYINCTDSHQTAPNYPELRYHQLLSRKRTEKTSPFSSPLKQTRSPLRKLRRMRTGMEQCNTSTTHESSLSGMFNKTTSISHGTNDMSLADFHTNSQENSSYLEFQEEIHAYTFLKLSMHKRRPQDIFIGIQDYFSITRPTCAQKSNVKYHRIIDAIADTKDTMMVMLHELHELYITQRKQNYLIVEGMPNYMKSFIH